MSRIHVQNVSKIFLTQSKKTVALDDISLTVNEGEFLCLVGPSGCGKSTLLYLIAGLDFPTSGTIQDDGEVITAPGPERMMMFQESALFPWLNVYENVLFGLNQKKSLTHVERKEIALHFLELVGLRDFIHSYVHELSGGMKQRVALARALAPNPHVLLMDEPFASLDALTREELYNDLQEIWMREKKTILFVTHNVAEAVCLGDRILIFSNSPGKIVEEHPIPLDRPRDIRELAIAEITAKVTKDLRKHLQRCR